MLKRSKYSRLRNDSLEERPQRMLPSKGDLCLDADFAQLDPETPTHQGPSILRDFIPRVANMRLKSPLHGLRGQTSAARDRTADGHNDGPLTRRDRGSGPDQRFSSQPSQNRTPSGLSCTKRPISLHGTAGLTWTHSCPPRTQKTRDGGSCLKTSSEDCTAVRTATRAVHHHIKYMGSVEVTQSMRTLDFDTRMQVTREAISRLCETTSTNTSLKAKRPMGKGRSAVLGQINLKFSGSRIILAVSTESLTLMAASSLQKIAHHHMQAISFASGGEPNMADYIAYVAKDLFNHRACHILECPQGRASEVISSIGQAFETRFRQLLSHSPSLLSSNHRSAAKICHKCRPVETITEQTQESETHEHRDYYNEISGKTPPADGIEDLQVSGEEKNLDADTHRVCSSLPASLYENCCLTENTTAPPADSVESEVIAGRCALLSETRIQEEGWFHGRLGRQQAESLLTCSGDFLVRESSSASGQYVLSGMEGAAVRHLLLVDPHGQVRTCDQVFLSVGHLVRFHMENRTPIVSGSSELFLKQPVLQRH